MANKKTDQDQSLLNKIDENTSIFFTNIISVADAQCSRIVEDHEEGKFDVYSVFEVQSLLDAIALKLETMKDVF